MRPVGLPRHGRRRGRGLEVEAVEAPPVLQRDPARLLEALQAPEGGRPGARAGPAAAAVAPPGGRRAGGRAARRRSAGGGRGREERGQRQRRLLGVGSGSAWKNHVIICIKFPYKQSAFLHTLIGVLLSLSLLSPLLSPLVSNLALWRIGYFSGRRDLPRHRWDLARARDQYVIS